MRGPGSSTLKVSDTYKIDRCLDARPFAKKHE